jgi:16S rRNA (adenine1518-N6/adenine1519-N6)-dimethyltransferase
MNSRRSRSTTSSPDLTRARLGRKTIEALRVLDVRPSKRLGQSFVIDPMLVDRLIELSGVSTGDVILEVGAGLGTLTEALADRCRKLYAVEVDKRLCSALHDLFGGRANVNVMCGDVLRIKLPSFQRVVSNPPFSICSKLIFRLLENDFENATMTLQAEFASRLLAAPGSRDYGRLTVATHLRADVVAHEEYPASAFYPQPKTKARIVELVPRGPKLDARLQLGLNSLLIYAFSQRKRRMETVLRSYAESTGGSARGWRPPEPIRDKRVFQLEPQEFLDTARALGCSA